MLNVKKKKVKHNFQYSGHVTDNEYSSKSNPSIGNIIFNRILRNKQTFLYGRRPETSMF